MNKREAKFTTEKVMPWIRIKKNSVFEAKETATIINDNNFEPQQLPSLRQATTDEGVAFKIADGAGRANLFDGLHVSNQNAYIAINYRDKGWVMITINNWDNRNKKNVDWEYAKEIASYWYI